MKITYTGRQVELAPAQIKKLEAQFSKIGKLLDGKREHEAHVILSLERYLHQAEVTVNYNRQQLVVVGSDSDLFTAIHAACDKLEKQLLKQRTKRRDSKRSPRKAASEAETEAPAAPDADTESESAPQVHKVNHLQNRKPMTMEEAILAIDKSRPYLAYRDAETDTMRVLIRRQDGGFDLVEG
jgi:putative sigma-54 modulation protein